MNASFLKRLGAYIIDVLLVSFVMILIGNFFITKNAVKISEEHNALNEQFLNQEVDFNTYYVRLADISLRMDKENLIINVINCAIMISYFIVMPLYKNGQTFGKKLMNIRIKREDDEDLTVNDLIIREIIINGLLNTLLSFCVVFLLPSFEYFTIVSILAIVQMLVIISSGIMMIIRNDSKGLQDLVTHTHVVDNKMEA